MSAPVQWLGVTQHIFLPLGYMQNFTQTDCDLIFTKVKAKGARKINFPEFCAALEHVAAKKKVRTSEDADHGLCSDHLEAVTFWNRQGCRTELQIYADLPAQSQALF